MTNSDDLDRVHLMAEKVYARVGRLHQRIARGNEEMERARRGMEAAALLVGKVRLPFAEPDDPPLDMAAGT